MIVQALRKGNYEHRVRIMSFERVMQRLELDYPGEGHKQLRIRLKNTARDFAAAFLAGVKKDFREQQRKATREALNQFEMTHQAKAADPDFMASMARETFAENRFMQLLGLWPSGSRTRAPSLGPALPRGEGALATQV